MRNLLAFLLCFVMILSLISCESNEDQGTLPQNDNANNISIQISEAKAIEMYEAAIKGELCVFDERLGETKIENLRFPSSDASLGESKLLTKAILDIDQDGVNEYVIKSPNNEHIILRYYNGKIYSYRLDVSDYYKFNTDGTFYWYDSFAAETEECGLNKIIFDGETLNVKSIYSLKYSSTATNYEYFVEGDAASEDEYYDYREQNIRKERVKFSQFEPTCSYPIIAEQAWNLANAYWDSPDGDVDAGAGTTWITRVVLTDTPNSDFDYYRVALQVEWNSGGGREGYECMPPYNIQLKEEILVNAFTGEITAPTYENISSEKAIEIAKKYWEAFNIEENGYRVEHAFNSWASDSVYVIVIKRFVIDHYSTFDEIWIDKTTGATIIPYDPDGTPSQTVAYYSDVIRLYKLAVRACVDEQLGGYSDSAEIFGITNPQEKELLADLQYGVYMRLDIGSGTPDSSSPIYKLSCGYAQKDLNGDGVDELVLLDENYTIMSIFSYADGKPIMIGGPDDAFFSDRRDLPDCWIDGEGVIHASTPYGFDHAWAYRVAEDGKSLEAIADYSLTLYAGGIAKYYSSVSGEAVEITKKEYNELEAKYSKYLGKYSGNEATRDYSGLKFVPLFSEAELIEEIYQSALDNKTKVYDVATEEYKFLKRCKTPYAKTYLCDDADLKYAFVDFDGDVIGEPVIDCGGMIVLRYYNRRVYAYSLIFRQAYDLKTDGSVSWNHTGERFEYGSNQIYFEGAELKTKQLWRIVDDGQPNAEYYIDGKRVSYDEMTKYIADNQKKDPEFFTFSSSWYSRISSKEAYELAKDHLHFRDEPDGALGTTIVPKLIEIDMPDDESVYYHFLWINEYYDHTMSGWENSAPYNMEVHKEVLVDVTTGECIVLNIRDYYNFGSRIAFGKVRDYLGINTGVPEINGETKIYSSLKVVDFPHCEAPYYRIAYTRAYYHFSEEGTEDESPYKTETIKEILVNSMTGECLERPDGATDDKG